MNQSQALRKAVKLFGKNAVIQAHKMQSSPEQRAIGRAQQKELNARCTTDELRKQFRKERDDALSQATYYRYSIGKIEMGLFCAIKACGDSWAGCFRALEKQPNAGTAYE